MSIVQGDIPESRVLDLFAGSGALGLEALSRGASHVDFVEVSTRSLAALRSNIRMIGAESLTTIYRGDAVRFLDTVEPGQYDLAFADPPYRLGVAETVAERWAASPFARVLGIEHEKELALRDSVDRRVYGDTVVTFYRIP